MQLTWLDPAHPDERDVAGVVGLREAARLVDTPHRLGDTAESFTALIRHGWDGDPPQVALARDEAGRPVGVLSVRMPPWDNTHLGTVVVTVDPGHRRRGVGRRLFEIGLARLREHGRTVVLGYGFDDAALRGFAAALAMDRVFEIAHRQQDLRTLDRDRLDREFTAARQRANDYELVRIAGPTPLELMPAVVAMTAAINDAPTGDLDVDDAVYSPSRIRAYEVAQEARGTRLYRLVARSRITGELAGHTVVGVDRSRPWWASQHDTSVLRTHRGHRLGILLKAGMVRWLDEVEPQLHLIDTTNASSNAHMVRVKELLGYRQVAMSSEWQRSV